MKFYSLIIHSFLFFCCTQLAFAQQLIIKYSANSKDSIVALQSNSAVMHSFEKSKIVSTSKIYTLEKKKYIVELTSPPAIEMRSKKLSPAPEIALQKNFIREQFQAQASSIKIEREFSEVVNGFVISADKIEIENIRSIKGIKKIHEDFSVNAFQTAVTSASRIISPQPNLITTGKGIKVGVIDTGIDYLHEALGGGIGMQFKVAGGYDFVNNDSDPQDDNGHGTHVAGIIAGHSSTFSGIAPNTILYAYKVLDHVGSGTVSTVLAGIERAMKDSVDIINISLGSSNGDPTDILSTAVDRTVRAGIIVIVAAGNSGEFGSVGSPGAAQLALTVGATDGKNTIASFSSKGPTNKVYGIKPDLVAPGVNIRSAKSGGGYISMSGTSMATPYVTGIAAALKELHPTWNAQNIRAAIIESTKDLNQSYFAQGNGKIDTSVVFSIQRYATPSNVSFGFNSPSLANWNKSDTLTFFNESAQAVTYTLTSTNTNPAIEFHFTPASFTIAPQQNATVTVEVKTNNSLLSNNAVFSSGYTGKIVALSAVDTLQIPYAFFKGTILQLAFDETPWQVLIHDQKNKSYTFTPKSASLSAVIPSGVYDVVTAFFNSRYVVQENVNLATTHSLTINSSDAVNQITITPSDETGKVLGAVGSNSTFSCIEGLLYNTGAFSLIGMAGGTMQSSTMEQKKYFSSVSAKYSFGYALNMQYGNTKSYTFDLALDSGITSSKNISFAPKDLKRVEFKYSVDSTVKRIFPITWSAFVQKENLVGVSYYNSNETSLYPPFVQTTFYTGRPSTKFPLYHFREAYKY